MTHLITLITFFYVLHKATVDIKIWTRSASQMPIRLRYNFLINDWVYLGGTFLMMFLLKDLGWFAHIAGLTYWQYTQAFLIGVLLGDQTWDLLFGYIVDQDPFFPYEDWFAGWGFNSKWERITFDAIRILLAGFISLL